MKYERFKLAISALKEYEPKPSPKLAASLAKELAPMLKPPFTEEKLRKVILNAQEVKLEFEILSHLPSIFNITKSEAEKCEKIFMEYYNQRIVDSSDEFLQYLKDQNIKTQPDGGSNRSNS